ncbi:MAG: hypothetical protein AVDCRST_MAG19-4919 [uncultured Thermomicrobiales bacterium]|uniref:TQO small subunit DoxD domain-containing protein n=1 Tax=uncultured Thermomicrobiales bacterium TaxID=1645740 RepID=A0A6J4VTM2_9BACT|nr:MAG: hypothetical protein AVDCRST_MAG19-4919 [uncultured Thermomicrobiales bacterium]
MRPSSAPVPSGTATASAVPLADPVLLGRGLAVLRIFVGVIFFANGVSKLTGETQIDIGPYRGNLINRDGARNILNFEVNRRDERGTEVPGLKSIVNDLILPNWDIFQWLVTAVEVGVGALLIVGLATRGAALVGLGFQLFLALVYVSSNRWAFEQPHEYVPLFILAAVPAGRFWGVDGGLVRNRRALRRWPF